MVKRSLLASGAVVTLFLAFFITSIAASAEPVKAGDMMEGVRNARYCEIIPVVREGLHLTATVYNTLGHNDCPPNIWAAISEDAMKERFGALMVEKIASVFGSMRPSK